MEIVLKIHFNYISKIYINYVHVNLSSELASLLF